MKRLNSRVIFPGAVVSILVESAQPVFGCSVCFGQAQSPVLEGMSVSILFLLAVTYFVLIGLALSFFLLRRKNRLTRYTNS